MFKKGQPVRIPFCNKEGVVEYESQLGNSYLVGVILLKAKNIAITPTLKWYQVKDLETVETINQYSSTKHPYAELMCLYAQDARETDKPWERWEISQGNLPWISMTHNPAWCVPAKYRRKPKTLLISNKEVNIGDKLYYNNQQGISFFGTVLEINFDSAVPRIALNKATNGNIDKNWTSWGTKYITRVIKIGSYDVPEPLRVAPAVGTYVYIPATTTGVLSTLSFVKEFGLRDTSCGLSMFKHIENLWLINGLFHLTKEAADLHAKALLSFTTTEINDE